MAKQKKVKKKAKKAKRKSGKKSTSKARSRTPKVDPQQLLRDKINRIKDRVPYIEPTGEELDPETGELLFRYTEAQHVFEVYREQCDIERLTWRPYADEHIQPKIVAVGNMPALIGFYCIEDRDTGAKVIGWGSGMGRNRDWSANTAGTRTLKQFLLTTFEATWDDPDKPKMDREQMREQVIRELEADGTLSRIEQIKFWAQNLGQKGKPDASTKGKDTGSRAGRGDKKNRTGAKRYDKRGRRSPS